MPAARLRPRAHEDLFDLWAFIAADSLRAADAVVDRLERAFELLAFQSRSGRARPDMGPDVRSFVVGKYVVFYRIAPGGIDVGRIVHGARNVAPEDI
jgi:toxin ParE1/3/4